MLNLRAHGNHCSDEKQIPHQLQRLNAAVNEYREVGELGLEHVFVRFFLYMRFSVVAKQHKTSLSGLVPEG